MFGKILASIFLIVVFYILAVFLAPNLSDGVADKLGMSGVNITLRDIKTGMDSTSTTLLQIMDASGAINTARDVVKYTNEKTNQTSEAIDATRRAGEQKVQQAQQTIDSIKKASQAIEEVQGNISSLTSLSGATPTGTGK